MSKKKSVFVYLLILLVSVTGIWFLVDYGSRLQPAAASSAASQAAPAHHESSGLQVVLENVRHPLSILLLQVIVIVIAARSLGAIFHRIGQPPVIGEMVAGILLGPSLLGWASPSAQAFLFPVDSLGALRMLSQIGVILFMFVVGIELDLDHLREKAHAAVMVSHTSIVLPFFLGVAGALFLYGPLAPAGVPFSAFALFMGVSMSITAFPVLARIIEERRLSRTYLGTTAIACAAVDDVTAWCLLAVVVALAKANSVTGALWTIGLSVVFIAAMLFLVRPRLARIR
jgi:Kef-type K+ transport system membrane component KefB